MLAFLVTLDWDETTYLYRCRASAITPIESRTLACTAFSTSSSTSSSRNRVTASSSSAHTSLSSRTSSGTPLSAVVVLEAEGSAADAPLLRAASVVGVLGAEKTGSAAGFAVVTEGIGGSASAGLGLGAGWKMRRRVAKAI